MTIVDGAAYAVPNANKEDFIAHSKMMSAVFKEYGALHVVDAWGTEVPDGEVTSFPMAVKCKEDETVCFSWITWESNEAREAGWEKTMADERMQQGPMPFDGKRMIFGTFEIVSEVK